MEFIGKLKKTLKERCPDCGKNLKVRERKLSCVEDGEDVVIGVEYIVCDFCGYEEEVENKKRRRLE